MLSRWTSETVHVLHANILFVNNPRINQLLCVPVISSKALGAALKEKCCGIRGVGVVQINFWIDVEVRYKCVM